MAKVSVPQSDGQVILFDGAESHVYKVTNGSIDVADNHIDSVLASVPGAAYKAPPKAVVVEAPPKEEK